jgi:hypothetical protein
MSQNYDEVKIDLTKLSQVNVLSATSRMEAADMTDCVENIEVVATSSGWTAERVKDWGPRQITFSIRNGASLAGKLVFNTEIGSVEFPRGSNLDLDGAWIRVRVTRINYNRRLRSTGHLPECPRNR